MQVSSWFAYSWVLILAKYLQKNMVNQSYLSMRSTYIDKSGTKQKRRHCQTIYNSYMQISLFSYSWIFIHICFWQKIHKQSRNIAVLDLFIFYFQNILGHFVSYFIEMIIFT